MQWIERGNVHSLLGASHTIRRVTARSALLAIAAGVALAGCSSDGEESLPAACGGGERDLHAALASAPGRVELDGTLLSGCLVKSSDPAEIQDVGATYLAVATDLGAAAAERPEGEEALRLGYLIGAVRRGAGRTQGIHSELVRRLEQEAAAISGSSDSYARGERAGLQSG
jgi:hypothetical protein